MYASSSAMQSADYRAHDGSEEQKAIMSQGAIRPETRATARSGAVLEADLATTR